MWREDFLSGSLKGFNRLFQKLNDCLMTRFVYDRDDAVLELNAENEIVHAYILGEKIDQPIERISFIHSSPRLRHVFHTDALGSIVAMSDDSGVTVQDYTYSAFGEIQTQSGVDMNRITYTARESLGDSLGFYYYRNRVMDSTTGRFISEDPIGFIDGPNRYLYVKSNPLYFIDPFGLDSLCYDGKDLIHYDDDGNVKGKYPATSGIPGHTDPNEKDAGPIPSGKYILNPNLISKAGPFRWLKGDWGTYRVPVQPSEGTDVKGRSGFYIHGGRKPGSRGCIDVGGNDKALFPDLIGHDGPIDVIVK